MVIFTVARREAHALTSSYWKLTPKSGYSSYSVNVLFASIRRLVRVGTVRNISAQDRRLRNLSYQSPPTSGHSLNWDVD
jgi:hypothetical protein